MTSQLRSVSDIGLIAWCNSCGAAWYIEDGPEPRFGCTACPFPRTSSSARQRYRAYLKANLPDTPKPRPLPPAKTCRLCGGKHHPLDGRACFRSPFGKVEWIWLPEADRFDAREPDAREDSAPAYASRAVRERHALARFLGEPSADCHFSQLPGAGGCYEVDAGSVPRVIEAIEWLDAAQRRNRRRNAATLSPTQAQRHLFAVATDCSNTKIAEAVPNGSRVMTSLFYYRHRPDQPSRIYAVIVSTWPAMFAVATEAAVRDSLAEVKRKTGTDYSGRRVRERSIAEQIEKGWTRDYSPWLWREHEYRPATVSPMLFEEYPFGMDRAAARREWGRRLAGLSSVSRDVCRIRHVLSTTELYADVRKKTPEHVWRGAIGTPAETDAPMNPALVKALDRLAARLDSAADAFLSMNGMTQGGEPVGQAGEKKTGDEATYQTLDDFEAAMRSMAVGVTFYPDHSAAEKDARARKRSKDRRLSRLLDARGELRRAEEIWRYEEPTGAALDDAIRAECRRRGLDPEVILEELRKHNEKMGQRLRYPLMFGFAWPTAVAVGALSAEVEATPRSPLSPPVDVHWNRWSADPFWTREPFGRAKPYDIRPDPYGGALLLPLEWQEDRSGEMGEDDYSEDSTPEVEQSLWDGGYGDTGYEPGDVPALGDEIRAARRLVREALAQRESLGRDILLTGVEAAKPSNHVIGERGTPDLTRGERHR